MVSINTVYDFLHTKNRYYNDGFRDDKFIIDKACYTGCRIEDVEELFDDLENHDEIVVKIIVEIQKTHEKINKLIESFNKDTNYKYKEIYKIRNNYCSNINCNRCNHLFISCNSSRKYTKLDISITDVDKIQRLTNDIHSAFVEIMNLKLE